MKRTISVMLGKGSVNHNSRLFMASNIDVERTQLNIVYCNTPIKDVYHELFAAAVERYNVKQTRSDRRIDDYYEKIRTGKQEKLFKEVIFQVGKMEDMSAKSLEGQLAAKILDEFMRNFQERNPNLRVFSAHLHMDEATPHLHVDFVPFIAGSKRGLDTRVSLKQALATQDFTGGTRFDTEWNQWVRSEKEQLSQVMARHGIEWEQLGTHEEHQSVLEFKKQERVKEVAVLESQISEKRETVDWLIEKTVAQKYELDDYSAELAEAEGKLESVREIEHFITSNTSRYDDEPEYQLSEPKALMSAKSYHYTVAVPLVRRLKDAIRSILLHFFEKTQELKAALDWANGRNKLLSDKIKRLEPENERLCLVEKDYSRVRQFLGGKRTDEIISKTKAQEEIRSQENAKNRPKIKRDYVR